jgi:hypothetical protein
MVNATLAFNLFTVVVHVLFDCNSATVLASRPSNFVVIALSKICERKLNYQFDLLERDNSTRSSMFFFKNHHVNFLGLLYLTQWVSVLDSATVWPTTVLTSFHKARLPAFRLLLPKHSWRVERTRAKLCLDTKLWSLRTGRARSTSVRWINLHFPASRQGDGSNVAKQLGLAGVGGIWQGSEPRSLLL